MYPSDTGIFRSVRVTGLLTGQSPVQNEKYWCCIDTVSSSDDGYIVARNMYRS